MRRMLSKRAWAALMLSILLVPMLAACGDTPAANTTPTGAATTTTGMAADTSPTAMMANETPTAMVADETPTAAMAEESPTAMTGGTGKKMRVGLVTDVGKINDGTFNEFAYAGLKRAETELGIEIAAIETQAQTDYGKNMDQFASQGFDMIIGVGFFMGEALQAAAAKYPNIKFAIVDFAYDPIIPNVRGLVFAEDQAGYLAGALAASMSKTNTIAVVGGVEGVPAVKKFVMGYENGAKSVKPDITVQKVYIDSFTDRARGAEAAKNFISQGADVIFGAGGQTGSGAIQAAAQEGAYVIGVDQDEYNTTFQRGAAPGSNKILSSAMKRVDNAVFAAIKDAQAGNFQGGTVAFDASTQGVGLAPFHNTEAEIPADVKANLDRILKGLADGSIKTGVDVK